ncbi:hypothetical protein [Clostridium botulinum]|uniref:hypothetical protein n=1 Tax=Clostridium botulinum TaxID=1491 RepID=UPI00196757F4|nr:hypothetical protein [Clostridium botulinum]MBN1058561.1 hypothetical protein [Clostridium botulinum]
MRYEAWERKDYIEHCKKIGMNEDKIITRANKFFKDKDIIVVDKEECYVKNGIRQEGDYAIIEDVITYKTVYNKRQKLIKKIKYMLFNVRYRKLIKEWEEIKKFDIKVY